MLLRRRIYSKLDNTPVVVHRKDGEVGGCLKAGVSLQSIRLLFRTRPHWFFGPDDNTAALYHVLL